MEWMPKIALPHIYTEHVQEAIPGNLTSDRRKSRFRSYITGAKDWVEARQESCAARWRSAAITWNSVEWQGYIVVGALV